MKKALFVLALALQAFGANVTVAAIDPIPACSPCPIAR
jgi:hypothetical protein